MPSRRAVSLGALVLVTAPWAMALTVLGLVLVFSPAGEAGGTLVQEQGVRRAVGVSAIACGQLVFLLCVCDRIFVRANRRLVVVVEGVLASLFVGGLGVSGVAALT